MANGELSLTAAETLHKQFMLEILKHIAETPLVLNGGTALMLAYGLDRFSEDLDFDAPHKLNLDSKISHSARRGITLEKIDVQKDTDTVTRYRVRYKTKEGERTLKIEISYRNATSEEDVEFYNGFRVYTIAKILGQKLLAAHDGDKTRTVIRDLYDIDFIARSHADKITAELAARLQSFAADPDHLISRYAQAYREDDLVQDRISLEDLALSLYDISDGLLKRRDGFN